MTHRLPVPGLAVALLLGASPARADDLLDAVLWDGPPSRSVPTPTPPRLPGPAVLSVPSVTVVPSASQPPPSPAPSASDSAPSAPAASDPVSGDLQLRREIQEMRNRADRLEAALGPEEPPKTARPLPDTYVAPSPAPKTNAPRPGPSPSAGVGATETHHMSPVSN